MWHLILVVPKQLLTIDCSWWKLCPFSKRFLIGLVYSVFISYLRCLEIRLSFCIITMHLSLSIFGGKVSLVSILQAGQVRNCFLVCARDFLFSNVLGLVLCCVHRPSYSVGMGWFSVWLKRQGCEADYSAPCSIEVSVWSNTSVPPYLLGTCIGTSSWRAGRLRYGKLGCKMMWCSG
jgi:hypothetical protein